MIWIACVLLILITISLHVTGIVEIARMINPFWSDDVSRRIAFFETIGGLIVVIVAVAVTLAIFHGVEALLWAFAYLWLNVVPSLSDAILYSLSSFTTLGASELHIEPAWRIMGVVEAGDGMLLFGISTAFLFSVMQRLWKRIAPSEWF